VNATTPPGPLEHLQLATFEVGTDLLAVDIMRIREISRALPITPVPRSPHGMVGVVDVRGQILPLFDLRVRFDLPPRTLADEPFVRHLVIRLDGKLLAIVVDRMHDVVSVERSAIRAGHGTLVGEAADVFVGVVMVAERLALLLNLRRIITKADRLALASLSLGSTVEPLTRRARS
jgi:purine-binding chemotaxis protein CheW